MDATAWPGVFREGRELFTVNATPGERVYGERLVTRGDLEYRAWDPFRSKLAALLLRGGPIELPRSVRTVLYLGAAHGTTASHLSDLWPQAAIFLVEKSVTSFAPLLALARRRANLYPILGDAQLPERYAADVGPVELLYQDVAQRAQAAIFVENARTLLAPGGVGVLMLKIRSVTQRRSAAAIVRAAREELTRAGLPVRGEVALAPFSREHSALWVGMPAAASTLR
ncbi:MAG TPA: fibrillarin-like rRNA/tRNA 2'-O-methyltransferase [Thermoplasmata archaeon]|nr:fibrillarin-like rRNA/tRNA 2'-O-methyltransferase [Thermoplasmata archaeon]